MISISPDFNEEIPPWDVALEALLRETCIRKGEPLDVHDIYRLSEEYIIRFDDLMTTLLALAVHGQWQYCDDNGGVHRISHEDAEWMRGGGRFDAEDVDRLKGRWQPLVQ